LFIKSNAACLSAPKTQYSTGPYFPNSSAAVLSARFIPLITFNDKSDAKKAFG